jgi:predicted TIM-barrel fold metal-dependent hydrolase
VKIPAGGAIDCDIHPALPGTQALVRYLDDYWREMILMRGLDRDNLDIGAYPPGAALSCRPDWRPAKGNPGTDFELLRAQTLDRFGSRFAICNVLHGAQVQFSEDLSAALCGAINDWLAAEWLDRDPRLPACSTA